MAVRAGFGRKFNRTAIQVVGIAKPGPFGRALGSLQMVKRLNQRFLITAVKTLLREKRRFPAPGSFEKPHPSGGRL
jgi:hypothetical protein